MPFKLITYSFLLSTIIVELTLSNNLIGSLCFIFSLLIFLVILSNIKRTISDIFILAFLIKLFVFAWIIKLLNFESITYKLLDQETTPFVILYSVILIFFIRLKINMSRYNGIINFKFYLYDLKSISKYFIFFGVVFQVLHVALKPVVLDSHDGGGFGGFGNFTSIGYLGIILYLYNMKKQGIIFLQLDYYLISVIIIYLTISLVSNTKFQIIIASISIIVSCLSFNLKFYKKYFLYGIVFLVFFTEVISPAIHATRSLQFRLAPFSEKIEFITEYFFNPTDNSHDHSDNARVGYLPYEGKIIDRFDVLTETDLVIMGVNTIGFVGQYPLTDGFSKALPGFLVPNRSQAAVTDKIMWDIREKNFLLISRIGIGVIPSVYAVSGFTSFFIFFPLIFYLFIYILIKLSGNDFRYNILGVFFITKYALYFTEQTFEGLISALLRDLPLNLALIYFILFFVKKIK